MIIHEVLGVVSWENNAPSRAGLREDPFRKERVAEERGAPRSDKLLGDKRYEEKAPKRRKV
jgi:hypothetical protein